MTLFFKIRYTVLTQNSSKADFGEAVSMARALRDVQIASRRAR